VATEVKLSTLAADAGGADGPLDPRTVADHLQALERLMVLENQPAWRSHQRSKAALRQAPRRHFCDPSLAVAALGGSPDRLLKDLEWLGLLFESLVIRDLRVLAQALEGELFHYRDDYGVEVGAIVELRDGRWGAIEIKLGPGQGRPPPQACCAFASRSIPAAPANPPSWRWSAAAAMATGAPMASPWCRWGHWGLEQAQAIDRDPLRLPGPGAAPSRLRYRPLPDRPRHQSRLPGPHRACRRGAVSPPDASN
jgi:hypothetical protein